jgi:hypothetical protein
MKPPRENLTKNEKEVNRQINHHWAVVERRVIARVNAVADP